MTQATFSAGTSPGLVSIAGVIRASRSYRDTFGDRRQATLIASPASTGQGRGLFEVFSPASLGAVGDAVDVVCRVTGVPHGYNITDDETGERRKVSTARHFLNAVQ